MDFINQNSKLGFSLSVLKTVSCWQQVQKNIENKHIHDRISAITSRGCCDAVWTTAEVVLNHKEIVLPQIEGAKYYNKTASALWIVRLVLMQQSHWHAALRKHHRKGRWGKGDFVKW